MPNQKRKKRALNGKPVDTYVETLVVTDQTIYNDMKAFVNSTNNNIILQNIRIYFAHVFNGINQRYQNSFSNDPDLNLNVVLQNILILQVR